MTSLPEQFSHSHAGQLCVRCPGCRERHEIPVGTPSASPVAHDRKYDCECGVRFMISAVERLPLYYTRILK